MIEAILEGGPMSRSDLASKMNVAKSAITEISHDLVQTGLLHEVSVVRNSLRKGRPSVLLSLNADRGCFLGVDLADSPRAMMLTDLLGTNLGECEIAGNGNPEAVVESMHRGIQRITRPLQGSAREILGVGIAVSGFVNHASGVCVYSAALDWHDVPIGELVAQSLGIPTYVDNDANAVAIAEKLFGEARELRNFSVVVLGANVGCAHYIDGQIYRGANSGAGEIGHMLAMPNGLQCRCGRQGCLDTVAGSEAILVAAREASLPVNDLKDLEALATKGNSQAIAILRNAGEALGLAVASIIQLNNPEFILFANVAGFDNGLFTVTTRQTIENNILPRFLASTRILFHHVQPSFLARGAACIAAHKFLFEQTGRQGNLVNKTDKIRDFLTDRLAGCG